LAALAAGTTGAIVVLHEPPDGVWKLVRYLLLSGGISVGIGIIGVALGIRFLPRVSLKVGLGYAVASVGAIITILYTPLLMFKQVQDLHLLALLLVSFLVLSFGMAAVIGLHMAERVRTLRWAAQEIAAGHFGTHVTVSWRDELSDLAAAFNRTSEEVERVFAHERAMEQERRDMVVAISHDLRTPLTGMRVMLEAIQDGIAADPETVVDYHNRMHGEIDHLTHLIDDLFELSRLESGAPLEVARIDLCELVRDSADSMALLAERHGVTLEVHLPSASEVVIGDPLQLQRVLANLLHNALRHTKPGGRINIASHSDAREISVEVTDTGEGIASEDLPHIFDRFYRAEKSRARHTGGSGLGLAISRTIVEAHGGHIRAESTAGEGSRFVFTLPFEGSAHVHPGQAS
jgi:two-component system, OmpR family, sensor histidine kinase BaeS